MLELNYTKKKKESMTRAKWNTEKEDQLVKSWQQPE